MKTRSARFCLIAGFVLGSSLTASAQPVESRAVKIGGTVHLSGVGARQAGQALRELRAPLRANGLSLDDIVSLDVWVTGTGAAAEAAKVFRSTFKRQPPAGTIGEVSALPGGGAVQIAGVAVRGGKRVIRPRHMENHQPFSPGIFVDGALYLSGQTSADPATGRLPAGDIRKHVTQALANSGSILRAADLDFSHVTQANVILTNPADFGPMSEPYRVFMQPPRPARVPLGATRLLLDSPVEITMRARREKGRPILPAGMEPSENYSWGFLIGNELYVAGIGSAKDQVEKGVAEGLNRVRQIVERAGFSMRDVVEARVYLSDIGNLEAVNRAFRVHFAGDRPPARAVVAVAQLPAKLTVMMSFTAAKP
ncbi:MAG: hypothetical protein FJW30_18350 [Acidobacteria bacterium]|nr:hypothetical protein [Acidobacteriota bacterium]